MVVNPHPENWHEDYFATKSGEGVRFGIALPDNSPPKAVVTLLHGRGESIEKYFETMRDLNAAGYACATIDWPGQGLSGRGLPDEPQKHHNTSYDDLLSALLKFKKDVIPSHIQNSGDIPQLLMGHSMGGHLGLRYLAEHEGDYQAAVFSAPLIRYHIIPPVKYNGKVVSAPAFLDKILFKIIKRADNDYIPFGGKWTEEKQLHQMDRLTSDARRHSYLRQAFLENPKLQVGSWSAITAKEAFRSCQKLKSETVETPTLIFMAENEMVVDNHAIKEFALKQHNMEVRTLEDALHEIPVERDEIRNKFMSGMTDFFDHHALKMN